MRTQNEGGLVFGLGVLFLLCVLVGGTCYGWPTYRVWQKEQAGKALLREAEWSRQIRIQEANAEFEAAKLLANAEVERAKGVAAANDIIAERLGGPEAYLRYLWIMGLQDGTSEVIYIPTEAQLPILEATRAIR
jgi:hypothetical protein